jgi:hypothetical protein
MREDLNKVVHEHERSGHKNTFKPYRRLKKFNPKVGGEDIGGRESMRHRLGWDGKTSRHNYVAIDGAIRKAVGKRWDDFYSELSKTVDHRSATGRAVYDHLDWNIERNLYVEDGELYIQNNYRREALKGSSTEFFVDPRDGIIKRNPKLVTYRQAAANRKAVQEAEEAKVYRKIDDNNCLRFIDGVWYHFEMKDVPKAEFEYLKPTNAGFETRNGRIVAREPVFRLGYALLGKGIIEKTWDELSGPEKVKFGVRVAKHGTVTDIFNGEYYPQAYRNPSKYHASKKTASQKVLRKAGLLK